MELKGHGSYLLLQNQLREPTSGLGVLQSSKVIAQPWTLVSPGVSFIITLVLCTLLSLSLPIPVAVYQPSANMHSQISLVGYDQSDQGIYGIRETCQTYLNTCYDLSTQASMHGY